MATKTWTGTTDTAWATSTNWSPVNAPSGGDDVIIGAATNAIAGSSPGTALASLTITPAAPTIGDASNALVLGAITTLTCSSRAAFTKIGSSGTITAAAIDLAVGAAFYATSGTWSSIALSGAGGLFEGSTGAVITALYETSAGLIVELYTNATGVTTFVNCGGSARSRGRNIATYIGDSAGKLTLREAAAITTIATIGRGHILNNQSSGTITRLDALPGSKYPCDGTETVHTITTLNRYSGSYINQYPPVGNITITTDTPIGRQQPAVIP